jgi:peptidoglycan/LPS O-acetylase OafA/YrhL
MAVAAYPYIPGGYQIAPFLVGCIIKVTQPALGTVLAFVAILVWWLSGAALLVQAGVVGLLALLLGTTGLPRDLPGDNLWKYLSDRTYCFYLIHGPVYLGVASFLDKRVFIVATLGTAFSAVATILLFNSEKVLSTGLTSLITRIRSWHIANSSPAIHLPDPPASSP